MPPSSPSLLPYILILFFERNTDDSVCSCNARCTGALAGSAFSHLIVNLDMQDSTGIFVAISHFHHCKLCTQESRGKKKPPKKLFLPNSASFPLLKWKEPPGKGSPMFKYSDLAHPKLAWLVVPRRKPQYLTKGPRCFEMLL